METQEWIMLIGGIVLILLSIAAVIFSVKSKNHVDKMLSAGLAEVTEFKASVKELVTEDSDGGKKFFVIFENENGEEVKISVTEEIFGDFVKGESGTLTLADDELLSFVIDEEV